MKTHVAPLVLLALILASTSNADAYNSSRSFGPFLGVGLSKNQAKVAQPGVDATLNGWGNSIEVGVDLPFSDVFGFTGSLAAEQKQLRNASQSSTYLDDTQLNSKEARGAFYYKNIFVGGSYQMSGVDLQTISTVNGSSSAHKDANGYSAFLGYSMQFHDILRANIEAESARFESPGFSYSDYSVGLKIQVLLSGLFEK